ncbi:MAG: OmpA family protein [Flavobacteriaceae bacterium]|nr:OmpA family protein [Flavobacteriaceae bacterium]
MKNVILIIFLTLTTTIHSQDSSQVYSKFTLEPSFGLTKIQDVTYLEFANYNIGARYMLNSKFGIRISATYTNNIENYYSGNIQGVINLGKVLDFQDFTKRYTILLGIGGDYTYLNSEPQSNLFHISSNFHLTGSIDNLYKINKNIALKASLNVVTGINNNQLSGVDASTTNSIGINLGVSINLDKKEHIDWLVVDNSPIIIDSTKTIIEKPVINNYITEGGDCNCSQNEYVFFDNNKSKIKTTALNAIIKIANYLIVNPEKEVTLIGYASNTNNTSASYDIKLSKLRAQIVLQKLVELGVSKDRIAIMFEGKDIKKEQSSFDLARRVELIIE